VTSLPLKPGARATVTIRNISTRRLIVTPAGADLRVTPLRVSLKPGRTTRIRVRTDEPRGSAGVLELTPTGGEPLRIPWLVLPKPPAGTLLPQATLDDTSFRPSDRTPAVLAVRAGRAYTGGGIRVEPVERLDVLLYTAAGAFVGVLARERDLLPGSYQFGVTGRSPTGSTLAPGRYELRLVAWPTGGGAPSRARVPFAILSG
jgi:hypothetical protein